MIKGRSGYLNIFTFSYSKHNFFLLIPREGVLELADLRWNSSVKNRCPGKIPVNGRKFKRQNMIAIRDGSKGVKGLLKGII